MVLLHLKYILVCSGPHSAHPDSGPCAVNFRHLNDIPRGNQWLEDTWRWEQKPPTPIHSIPYSSHSAITYTLWLMLSCTIARMQRISPRMFSFAPIAPSLSTNLSAQ